MSPAAMDLSDWVCELMAAKKDENWQVSTINSKKTKMRDMYEKEQL